MAVLTREPKQRRGGIAPPQWPEGFDPGGDGNEFGGPFPVSKGYLAVWVLLTAVTMLFAGLSSAYIVLRGVPAWQNISMPSMVWVNTMVLLASSVAIELARNAVKRGHQGAMKQWLAVSGILGFAFLLGQIAVWRQLANAGIYLATNLHSSFFYVLTGAHALHLAGGLIGLAVVIQGAFAYRLTPVNHEPLKVWALYWHFMDLVWIYLFLLLLLA
jgi:cytochrome c oxidase subunit III